MVQSFCLIYLRLAIFNYLPISTYSGLLAFDMKMFVNIARLNIGQLLTQSERRGHPCTLETFLDFRKFCNYNYTVSPLPPS